ncbi:hypothetical protein [Asaia spathodeae]|uniref:Uncharacterized protein n=1 Tax=Asaia spathodeae TaxID=657016 RepID=A0ABX2P4H4_9PROT|nr:hypothetical protein [Asaia spathodeae]
MEGFACKPENNNRFIATKGTRHMMYPTLDSLFEAIKTGAVGLSFSLPTYGGDEPLNAPEIWSWDADRYMVGTCAADLTLVPRDQWAGDVKLEG